MNNITIVGRLVADPEVKELESGKKVTNVTVAVPRSYKNANGEYDTDFLDCVVWNNAAFNLQEFCKKGDLLSIKGRVETSLYEKEDGTKHKSTQIVADKVIFLDKPNKKHDNSKNEEDIDI